MSKWATLFERQDPRTLIKNEPILTMLRTIRDAVLPPAKLLEVGFGTGFSAAYLTDWGYQVTGIDKDREVLELASRRIVEENLGLPHFLLMDAFALSPTFQFDLAYSQGFLEHFSDEDIIKLLQQQLRVATKVIFSVPSENYPASEYGDERKLSMPKWVELMTAAAPEHEYSIKYYHYDWHLLGILTPKGETP